MEKEGEVRKQLHRKKKIGKKEKRENVKVNGKLFAVAFHIERYE